MTSILRNVPEAKFFVVSKNNVNIWGFATDLYKIGLVKTDIGVWKIKNLKV